jgi:hypothetical protein
VIVSTVASWVTTADRQNEKALFTARSSRCPAAIHVSWRSVQVMPVPEHLVVAQQERGEALRARRLIDCDLAGPTEVTHSLLDPNRRQLSGTVESCQAPSAPSVVFYMIAEDSGDERAPSDALPNHERAAMCNRCLRVISLGIKDGV